MDCCTKVANTLIRFPIRQMGCARGHLTRHFVGSQVLPERRSRPSFRGADDAWASRNCCDPLRHHSWAPSTRHVHTEIETSGLLRKRTFKRAR